MPRKLSLVLGVIVLICLCESSLRAEQTAPQKNALEVIQGNRGGRHWVDAETAPPKSPAETLKSLEIEDGYEISLFAAEPLIHDPVAITFDQQGNMFVVEYGDYPIGPPEGGQPLSKIVMLEDTDHDGIADKRHVFADQLDFAHSLMAYRDGLLVGAKTKILYLRDTDGDHVADVRETLFDGFKPAHPQMQIGNPRWGLDNWIYLNYGPGDLQTQDTGSKDSEIRIKMPRKDVRFHPHSMRIEADGGLGQFGNTINRWGQRFYCTNRNPIITTFLSPAVTSRNPFHVVSRTQYDVGKAGGETRVYPLVKMKSNYLSHAGTHTAACGTTAYGGDLGNADYRESVFVCEPIGHLVTRSIVRASDQSDRLLATAKRAQEKSDFVASTDTWFRPSSLATGPDGSLFLADMYRLWVEHPKFLPPEIAAKLDWRAGDDLGRIYRIVPTGEKPKAFQSPQSINDTVALLADTNAWRQTLGQRLLVEKKSREAVDLVRKLLTHQNPTVRLRALWTLDGLTSLGSADVIAAMGDQNANVRIAGVTLARGFVADAGNAKLLSTVTSLADDPNVRVRFHVALALSASESPKTTELLSRMAIRDGRDSWFADGLLTSAKTRSGEILKSLVASDAFVANGDAGGIELVKKLASIVGARGDVSELNQLFGGLAVKRGGDWWKAATITGLGQGLPRHRGELGRMTLAKMISNPPQPLAQSIQNLKQIFDDSQRIARDAERDVSDRAAAVELLSHQPFTKASPTFKELLTNDQPIEVQTACINALARNGSKDAAKVVLDLWSQLGPTVRGSALDLLMRRVESTRLALDAMTAGTMNVSALSIDQRVRLLQHKDADLKKQATKLFGGAVSANRQKVAKDYEPCLAFQADATDGKKVFQRICAACHKINGVGHDAGPDLSDVRNRSKPALLYDILDPNSKVEPRFTAYSVLTLDGVVFNGLIVSETSEAVVLKMAEGKQQTIGRVEIDQIKVSDVSLMPEGIEKDITPQQMADLLEYLKAGE